MKAKIRKRAFSLLLALVMICSLLPTAALAADDDSLDGNQSVVCTMDETCQAEEHSEDCPRYTQQEEPSEGNGNSGEAAEGTPVAAPIDPSLTALQERIDDLPGVDELETMDEERQAEVNEEVCAIYDAIDELIGEEAKSLELSRLKAAAEFFNRQIMPLDTTEPAAPADRNLDLSAGSIVITATGYKQGTIDYGSDTKYGAAFTVKNGEDEVKETSYTGSYVITQSGGSTSNGIRIEGLAENQTVTLNGVNITKPVTGSGIVIWKSATVTLLLAGENSMTGVDSNPGICVAQNAVLTIDNGQEDGLGKLTAVGNSNSAGIGATNQNQAITDDSTNAYGSITVNGGEITAKSGGSNYQAAGIGSGYGRAAAKVVLNGGIVHVPVSNQTAGIRAQQIEIHGGWLDYTGTGSAAPRYTSNSALPVVTGGSLTKGDDTYGTEPAQYRRVVIAFGNGEEMPKALKNTEITVYPGNDTDSTSWKAYTDANGLLYAYLPSGAEKVTVQIPWETSTREITLKESETALSVALSGISCVCEEHHGALIMTTASQTVTTVNDQAALELGASYTPSSACELPDGYGFHGAYEEAPSYEVVSVTRNGQFMNTDRYVSLSDSTATFYGDADQDPYLVSIRALCGPENNKVYSEPITVTVNTYVYESEALEGELDIGNGSILITDTGYSQGVISFTTGTNNGFSVTDASGNAVTETAWPEGGDPHTLTVTGSNGGMTSDHIVILGGAPVLTLKNVNIAVTSGAPAIGLVSGASADAKNTATLVLEGNNSLTTISGNWPAVLIPNHAVLTIQGDGTLTAAGNGAYAPGIGTVNNTNSYYTINRTTYAYDNNNMRKGGELIINSGTITASNTHAPAGVIGSAGSNAMVHFSKVTINGGTITCRTAVNGYGIYALEININGGQILVEAADSGKTNLGLNAHNGAFVMSSGTITMVNPKNTTAISGSTGVTITGGNINTYYSGEVTGRTLTKLYFVTEDGSPVANTEVTVTKGTGDEANTWTALTDANGIITTYFASSTDSITVSYGDKTNVSVSLKDGQALIGGTCTCSSFSDVAWDTGLPATVTLYGGSETTYAVANAKLVVDGACPMPIHPNLAAITYSLSVTKNGSAVGDDDMGSYAVLENGVLTLKPSNAPYTVTLTASAGDKSDTFTLEVKSGEAGETMVIDLSTETDNTKTISEDTTAIVTGNAGAGTVNVTGGTASLTLNQDSAGNVWSVTAGESTNAVTLNAQTVNGKVRFGNTDDQQTLMGYISADKVKLNPDAGDIAIGADGSITQGKFTLTGLGDRAITVMGADTEAARTIKNDSAESVTLTVNGEKVTLAASQTYTVEKALGVETNAAGTTTAYIMPGGRELYEHYTTAADGMKSYSLCNTASTAPSNRVEGYRLLIVAEGDAKPDGYIFKDKILFEKEENSTYNSYYTASRITEAVVDEDVTGTLYASALLYQANLKELHAESVSDIIVYTGNLGEVYFGDNLSSFTWGNYCTTTGVHIPESNPNFATDDGVLYTKDYGTLLLIPSGRKAAYTVREECTRINANATMACSASSITIGENVSYIGGTYIFYNNHVGEFRVVAGNQYFAAKDGILYDADFTRMVAYPRASTRTELTVPDTLTYVEALILGGMPIKAITVPAGANITGDQSGFGRIAALEEVILEGSYAGRFDQAVNMKKLTVPDGFNFSQNLAACSMDWIKSAGITVSGGGNIPYDGEGHGITVAATDTTAAVTYSTDGETYSETAPAFTAPGEYTVYWKITKAADAAYAFERELYSSRTFTISALEASEDWFTLTTVQPDSTDTDFTPVTLSQPAAAPSLEGGYTVKYQKDGKGEASTKVPTEAGSYLVTVEITAEGYAEETLTLGWYTILSEAQSGSIVMSFITNGGSAIENIVGTSGSSVTVPSDPTRNGYAFAGWYSDAALHTKVDSIPATMPSENTTYYAKWMRETYTITYNLNSGVNAADNPVSYTVESATFSLAAPTRPGYTFKGWTWDGQTAPQAEVTVEHGSYGNKTYTANWEEITYTIAYPERFDVVDSNPKNYTASSTDDTGISLTAPAVREGYTFSGWAMSVDGVVSILPAENAEIPQGTLGNITLTGIWLAQDQTLTLNANGGKFASGSTTMTITAEYASGISLTTPARDDGYNFDGWYTDEALTAPFTAVSMPLSTTLYAKWTPISYSITYAGMDGAANSNPTSYTVETETFTLTAPTRSGYTFTGWTYEGVTTPTMTVQVVKGTMGNKTFTANWSQNSYSGGGSSGSTTYAVSVDSGKNGTVSVSPKNASKGSTVTITVKPDSGYELDELTVMDKNSDELRLTRKSDTQYTFTMPASKVTVEASFVKEASPDVPTTLSFVDVPATAYYANAVEWAVENGVTSGTSATTFSPNASCTRAQAVTFLWRAAGSPAPKATSNPFTDVSSSAYYYEAVLWAVENGVTAGTSNTTFSPDNTCTRGQIVTFLYRANGSPAASGSSFADVAADAYYANAVDWVVDEGITVGTGPTTFSPDADCTRAQIVTFLWRDRA